MRMLNSLKSSLQKNNRIDVIYSGVFTKIIGLVSVFFLTLVLVPSDYGNLTYVLALINIIVPFLGLGLNHSLLRYGDCSSKEELNKLTSFALYRGSIITLFEAIIMLLFVYLTNSDMEILRISIILSLQLLFSYPLKILQSKLRLEKRNKEFAKTVFVNSSSLLLLLIIGYYTLGFDGILIAYVAYPLISFIVSLGKNIDMFRFVRLDRKTNQGELYKYGIYVGLGSVASQLLYSLDIIMLQNILNDSVTVAIYKVASLVSVNGLIFSNHIMSADFVYIKELKTTDLKKYSKKLISKLFLFSILIFIASLPIVYVATYFLLDPVYKSSFILHVILMIGFIFSFSIRIPIGTLLSARGFANYNVINAYISIGINLVLNLLFIYKFGYLGVAFSTVITMIIGSYLSLLFFRRILTKSN